MNLKRRNFIQLTTATIGALSLPDIVQAAIGEEANKSVVLRSDEVLLFQGDSITDAGRDRNPPKYSISNAARDGEYNDFNVMGSGYAMLAAAQILLNHYDKSLKIFNRGVSGNRVYQLAERWKEDCLDLQPSVLSILIGVNDFWHTLNGDYSGSAEKYRTDLKQLLDRTKQSLPEIKLIIGEPFAINGLQAISDKWYPAFDEYRSIAKDIADQYDAVFIPYQKIFDKALTKAPAAYWSFDGVHPSVPGAMLMTEAWLKAIKIKK